MLAGIVSEHLFDCGDVARMHPDQLWFLVKGRNFGMVLIERYRDVFGEVAAAHGTA